MGLILQCFNRLGGVITAVTAILSVICGFMAYTHHKQERELISDLNSVIPCFSEKETSVIEAEKKDAEKRYALQLLYEHFERYVNERVNITINGEQNGLNQTGGFLFRDRFFKWLFGIPGALALFVAVADIMLYLGTYAREGFLVKYLESSDSSLIFSFVAVCICCILVSEFGTILRCVNRWFWRKRLIYTGFQKFIKPGHQRSRIVNNDQLINSSYLMLEKQVAKESASSFKKNRYSRYRGVWAAICLAWPLYIDLFGVLTIKASFAEGSYRYQLLEIFSTSSLLIWLVSIMLFSGISLYQTLVPKGEIGMTFKKIK